MSGALPPRWPVTSTLIANYAVLSNCIRPHWSARGDLRSGAPPESHDGLISHCAGSANTPENTLARHNRDP
jgi:hypothetical protein